MSKRKVFWTDQAVHSQNSIYHFVSSKWGESVAAEFEIIIDNAVEHLSEMGQQFQNSRFRKLVVHEHIAVFYRIVDDYIKINLVWDNRQDPEKLKDLLKE